MTKYTAINIGPIVGTLGLARGPKDLWAASYMFSCLMEKIVAKLKEAGFEIISPAQAEKNEEIGLYPDRAFIKNPDGKDITGLLDGVLEEFANELGIGKDYVNFMHTSIEEDDEKKVLARLNQILDCAELMNRAPKDESLNKVRDLITKHADILGDRKIPSIEDIAERSGGGYTYSNYICIVQADGDGMGNRISGLSLAGVGDLSKDLLEKGKVACEKIKEYGGEAIYAGGDDLLFLAPVASKDSNIFELLADLDKAHGDINMSFGLSITYHKYPLYEALKAARKLLFEKAKNVEDKHAIAWCLRKHSGSGFEGTLQINSDVYKVFDKLMQVSADGNRDQVSAIAHKLRANEDLLGIIRESADREKRINAFYAKFIDQNTAYAKCTKELLSALFVAFEKEKDGEKEEDKVIRKILTTLYGILRTAKFVNGEYE